MRCENCKRELAGVASPFGTIFVCGRADCLAAAMHAAAVASSGAPERR